MCTVLDGCAQLVLSMCKHCHDAATLTADNCNAPTETSVWSQGYVWVTVNVLYDMSTTWWLGFWFQGYLWVSSDVMTKMVIQGSFATYCNICIFWQFSGVLKLHVLCVSVHSFSGIYDIRLTDFRPCLIIRDRQPAAQIYIHYQPTAAVHRLLCTAQTGITALP